MMKKKTIIVAVVVIVILSATLYITLRSQNISQWPSNKQTTQTVTQNEVLINNASFSPETITIKAGSYVIFVNKDSVAQTITESNKVFDKEIKPGDTLKITFDKTGTYDYFCSIQPSIKGKVIVQ